MTFRSTRNLTTPSLLAIAAAASLALASCSTATASGAESSGGLKVVATTTQLADFAAEIGGNDIDLTGLLPAGASAHHFDPTPADLLALGNADVLIVNGAGLETFIDSAVDSSGFSGTIITAADGIDLDEARAITAESEHEDAETDHDHADDQDGATDDDHGGEVQEHDHADEHEVEHADEAHDHDAEHEHGEADADEHAEVHDHDHGDLNPHIWTSPTYAEDMVSHIADEMSHIDPDHAEAYGTRAADYIAELDALDTWIADQFAQVPDATRVLVSGHDSLRYYLHDYDIAFAGSILPSFEDNAEPSAAEIDALVQTIRDRGVPAIFVESSMSPKLAQTIAKEADVEVVDAETLYADSLGAADSDAAHYLDATELNTRVILNAWGFTPGAR